MEGCAEMDLKFEKATELDAETFVEIQNKAFFKDFKKYGECPGYGRTTQSMKESMKKNLQYKILVDDIAVGKVSAHEIEGECHLDCLCIIPEYENKGIGQKAVAFIEEQFPQARNWSLETPKNKLENHYFYKKCGYEIVNEKIDGNVTLVIFSKGKYN